MKDAEIITALGGTAKVAEALGVALNTTSNWKGRGIPWQMRPKVKALARRKRLALPADFLTVKAL